MASRLETTRSLECQPLPPPRSQQWLLKREAQKAKNLMKKIYPTGHVKKKLDIFQL